MMMMRWCPTAAERREIVRCGRDIFGDGAAEIVNVKIFADAETLLEGASTVW